jgi:tRNA A58 N-methylase Trm61
MTVLEDETDPLYEAEADKIKQAREDVRIVNLRNNIFSVIKGVVELWSADAAIAQVFVNIPASNNSYTLCRH